MIVSDNNFDINSYCKRCNSESKELFGCIKCGHTVCLDCVDGHISDWECICKECGW